MPKLIITNGDGAVERLRAASVEGHLLPWRDVLHDGPVPGGGNLDLVSDARAQFLSETLGADLAGVRADFADRDARLQVHPAYGEVELWFEHDLYDQLQLIQIIHYFAGEPERLGLFLVQAADYLGGMGEDEIRALAPSRTPLTHLQMETAQAAWAAFTAPTPEAVAAFVQARHECLPFLVPALRRLLAELPAPGTGLSLTEERILRALTDGPMAAGRLFGKVTTMEEAQFLGDLSFFLRLDGLAFAPTPLITGLPFPMADAAPLGFTLGEESAAAQRYRTYAESEVSLTPAGEAALAGQFDHARENSADRRMGGFRTSPDAPWRYDREAGALVTP